MHQLHWIYFENKISKYILSYWLGTPQNKGGKKYIDTYNYMKFIHLTLKYILPFLKQNVDFKLYFLWNTYVNMTCTARI